MINKSTRAPIRQLISGEQDQKASRQTAFKGNFDATVGRRQSKYYRKKFSHSNARSRL
jgi:hypothetical protein